LLFGPALFLDPPSTFDNHELTNSLNLDLSSFPLCQVVATERRLKVGVQLFGRFGHDAIVSKSATGVWLN
jgi:hypothetical protein